MTRWHERGCRFPEVSIAGGIPCCNYCFAIPSLEDGGKDEPSIPLPPPLQSRTQMNLDWPPCVSYNQSNGGSGYRKPTIKDRSVPPNSQSEANTFPATKFGDGFRLIRLKSSRNIDSPIHAEIVLYRLSNNPLPVYDALSYTYADEIEDSTRCYPIFLGPYWDVVYLTRNCREALQSIRHQDADRLVWVDCLCINQQCIEEKNHQASLIRTIYQNASWIIFYLGARSADSDLTLNYLRTAAAAKPGCSWPKDQNSQVALNSLFQRPCFSRLWLTQEARLARCLELNCGGHSVLWQARPSMVGLSDISAPTWLFDQDSHFGRKSSGLLHLLVDASPYKTSDPRDKVFAVLSLACEEGFTPDYNLPVESVYIGVTAHIIQNLHCFEVLSLAGASQKEFNTPSWVPDWSQNLVQRFPQGLLHSEVDVWPDDVGMDFAMRLVFDSLADSNPTDMQVNANTGSLQVRATKLCDISGTVSWAIGRSKIAVVMPFGERGTLVISLLDKSYKIGTDSLFLLNGWDHPVILRSDPVTGSHGLVSVCAVYYTPPPRGTWLNPWIGTVIDSPPELRISKFSPEENDLILAFYSRLMELSDVNFSSEQEDAGRIRSDAARARILDLGLLSMTPLREIEWSLKNTWNELDQKIGWMCLDQVAVLKLLKDISQGASEHPTTGHGQIRLNESKEAKFKQYSTCEFSSEYEWDLRRFCWSFVLPSTSPLTISDSIWTPIYPKLKEQLTEFQRWAEVTEQLFRVFQYSHDSLARSWNLFPGADLPGKWLSNWENFCNATAFDSSKEVSAKQPLDTNCFWDWREFKNSLRLREDIWNEGSPPLLDPSTSPNIAAHLGLKSLGLNLYCQTQVTIS